MRRTALRLLLAAPFLFACESEPEVETDTTIFGTITDVETGEPLAGVVIETTPATQRVESDAAGNFEITEGPKLANRYQVRVEQDGYESVSKTITTSPTEENRIDFQLTILKICTAGDTRCALGIAEAGIETCAARGNLWEPELCGAGEVCVDAPAVSCVPARNLSVMTVGAGEGQVVSSPGGIICGQSCDAAYADGTVVTLTATPLALSGFGGWTGDCTGTEFTCTVTMAADRNLVARFEPTGFSLTVETNGLGSGRIRSTPAGILCGTGTLPRGTCTSPFAIDEVVTLTANTEPGSTFGGWGGPCTGTGDCVVTMDQARTVTAQIDTQTYPLTVNTNGMGAGLVTSAPAGIDCGATCVSDFVENDMVTLTASAAFQSTFVSWGGDCAGTQLDCMVTMDQARNVTATFDGIAHPVDVTVVGDGTVVSAPSGISCDPTCSATFGPGTQLTLTANPNAPSLFTSWGGDCAPAGANPVCMLTVNGPVTASAQFDVGQVDLTVGVTGNGNVSSTPVGIDCGVTCQASFTGGTVVTLDATPLGTDVFSGWGGACAVAGNNPSCMLTLNANATTNALFEPFYLVPLVADGNCVNLYHFDNATPLVDTCGGAPAAALTGGWNQITSRSVALADAYQAVGDEQGYIATNKNAPAPGDTTIELTIRKAGAAFNGRTVAALYSDIDQVAPGPGVRLLVHDNGDLVVHTTGAGGTTSATAAAAIVDATWTHVAATISPANGLTLFVDGTQVAQNPAAALWTASSSTAWVGAERAGAGAINRFNGDLDELRVSDNLRY